MKRKIPKILGVGLAFLLVASLMAFAVPVAAADYKENDWKSWGLPDTDPDTDVGPIAVAPDGTLYAAVGTVGTATLGSNPGGTETAVWSTTQTYTDRDYSALLTRDGTGDDGSVYVEFVPAAGITLANFQAALATFSFWHYSSAVTGNFAQFELRFTDPDSTTGWVEVTAVGLQNHTGNGTSFVQEALAGATPSGYGGVGETGTSFFNWTLTALSGIEAAVDGETAVNDASDWELTRVRIELWETSPARTTYISDITIDNVTYNLEPPKLVKSEDDGYTWDDTELDPASNRIVDIAISPNYGDDETLYVGTADGTVYRLEDAGEGDVIAIKDIVDSNGDTVTELFSMDVWTDEDDYNWILVGTNLDVLVLKDKTFEDWRDQELAAGGDYWVAYEVAFAPDFDESELIWAVIDDAINGGDDFLVTATASPGKWGQDIGEVDLGDDVTADGDATASRYVDIGFPDDYDSDPDTGDTNLWVAVSSPDTGDIFLIEGVDAVDGPSNAISMFAGIGGEIAADFISIAVSGDYGDEIILAGELNSPTVWISDDGGYGWDEVDKSPTGAGMTYVIMEADVVWDGDVFDPDDGMAFAATAGAESAVSRSNDGGQVYNQVGLIDTEIELILDLGFHPDFPDTPTYLMSTHSTTSSIVGTTSLWLTENGDDDEPDYVRVLAGDPTETVGNFAGWFGLVEYSADGDAIYIAGTDDSLDPRSDAANSVIWKSTNDGQTFGKKRSVKDNAFIRDWVITEDDTIYAATWDFDYTDNGKGFYMTTNSGLSWTSAGLNENMNDIALSPDFEDDETILIGGMAGDVYMSSNGGDTLKNAEKEEDAALTGDVFVAFDADYADEDADGFMLIYAVGNENNDGPDNAIQVGEVTDPDDVDWDNLEADVNDGTADIYATGLVVSEDNVLYAVFTGNGILSDFDAPITDLARLILQEDDSEWQWADDTALNDPFHLWITPGSNVLWTIDMVDAELWVLEDTLSGQVTLDSPSDGYQSDRLTTIRIAWDEMRDADEYHYLLDETSGLAADGPPADDEGYTDDTSINIAVESSAEYDWKVRVAPLEFDNDESDTWHSRWSDEWTFNTALGDAPWAPSLYTPGGIWQYSGLNVELMPAFSWESAKNADSYQFVLADNAEFTSPLVNEKVPESAFNLGFELEYNSNYFWRVMAYNGNKAVSRWSDIGAFTTIKTPGAPPPPLPPPATVTQPAPAPIVIPTPIPPVLLWVIVGIGAALIIAVIILIIRTRRAV